MHQAIQTRYLGPTAKLGARVVAECQGGKLVSPWDHGFGIEANHEEAARDLANKMNWKGRLVGGGLPGSGYAFVILDEE